MQDKAIEIKNKLDVLNLECKLLEAKKDTLRIEYKSWFTDRSIDLDVRWKIFVDSGIGSHEEWIHHWSSLKAYKQGYSDVESNFIHSGELFDRSSRIDVDAIVEILQDKVDEGLLARIADYYNDNDDCFAQDGIDKFKEEVLEAMVASYTFDW